MTRTKIREVVSEAVRDGAFPGVVFIVGREEQTLCIDALGSRSLFPEQEPMQIDTIFDLASLTKVVATVPSIAILCQRGKLSLEEKVNRILPSLSGNRKELVTVKHLLTHTSGLKDWSDFYTRHEKDQILLEILKGKPKYEIGSKVLYSDLGFILLGDIVEEVAGIGLDRFCRDNIFGPLGMSETTFNPDKSLVDRCASTEYSNWRLRILKGEVHDENAYAMGGVSGHAGLFSSAQDLSRFAMMVANEGELKGRRILSSESVQSITKCHTGHLNEKRGLGWLIEPGFTNSGRWSIGHNGYTGTSMAICMHDRSLAILLTNRVHPVREGIHPEDRSVGIMMLRKRSWSSFLPQFYEAATELIEKEH